MTKHKYTYRDIIGPSGCLSREGMRRAVSGRLDPLEKHRVDKHLAGCELCREALEGMRQTESTEAGMAALLADMDSKAPRWAKPSGQSTGAGKSPVARIVKMPMAAKITSLVAVAASITLVVTILNTDYTTVKEETKYEDLATEEGTSLPTEDATTLSMAEPVKEEALTHRKNKLAEEQGEMHSPKAPHKKSTNEEKDQATDIRDQENKGKSEEKTAEVEKSAPSGTGGNAPETSESEGYRADVVVEELEEDMAPAPQELSSRREKAVSDQTEDNERGFNFWSLFGKKSKASKTAEMARADEAKDAGRPQSQKRKKKGGAEEGGGQVYSFAHMEDPPVFFMGNDSISTWVESQIHYPPEAKDNGIEGYVVISFIIDQTGKVGNVRITRPANNLLNQEAIRVIRSMPDWQPGRQHGKPVSVEFTLPVRFRL